MKSSSGLFDPATRRSRQDCYAVGGLSRLAKMAGMDEFTAPQAEKGFVGGLVAAHEKLVEDAKEARDLAEEEEDMESQDLMIARITWHQKTLWMLKSNLKG